jgi:Holliday junction DNA helicase RuvB
MIILRSSAIMKVEIKDDAALEIAKRSRGTPRIANRLLKRLRDFAQVLGDGSINLDIARSSLHSLDVDHRGLDDMDRRLLLTIIEKFGGGPVGVETIAASLREDRETIEDVYEPYLMQEGFLERTPRGRLATRHAYAHLGKAAPERAEGLF